MPAKYQATCVLPLAAHEYFLAKDSPAYTSLLAKIQKLKAITFIELLPCDDPDTDIMHMLCEPDLTAYVPGSLMRFINFDTAVHDHVTYVREKVAGPTYEWSVQEHLPSMGTNFSNTYQMRLEPIDDKRCKLHASGEVAIKMRMIGGTAERITSESIVKGIESMHVVLARWVEVRDKMMETEEGRKALLEGRPPLNVIPKEALEALARPYSAPQEPSAPQGREEIEGDVFYDAEELVQVLEVPEDASPALLSTLAGDAAELYEAVQAEGGVGDGEVGVVKLATPRGAEEEAGGGEARGEKRQHKTQAKLKATLRRAQEDWNAQFDDWSSFWDKHQAYIALPAPSDFAARLKNIVKIANGLDVLELDQSAGADRQVSHTRQWFQARLQELAETERRNRSTFNRAMSSVLSSRGSAAPVAVDDGDTQGPACANRHLDRLGTGLMTGMGTVAGGVALGVGAVTDGVANLLKPSASGKKGTTQDASGGGSK